MDLDANTNLSRRIWLHTPHTHKTQSRPTVRPLTHKLANFFLGTEPKCRSARPSPHWHWQCCLPSRPISRLPVSHTRTGVLTTTTIVILLCMRPRTCGFMENISVNLMYHLVLIMNLCIFHTAYQSISYDSPNKQSLHKETIMHGHGRHNTAILPIIHNTSITCFGQYCFWPSSGWIQLPEKNYTICNMIQYNHQC
jgi:hypothetical protein